MRKVSTFYSYYDRSQPIPRVNTLHGLAWHLLKEELQTDTIEGSRELQAQYIMDLVDSDTGGFNYYSALPVIAKMIVYKNLLSKNFGTYPLSNRDNKQLVFIITKTLEKSLTLYTQ